MPWIQGWETENWNIIWFLSVAYDPMKADPSLPNCLGTPSLSSPSSLQSSDIVTWTNVFPKKLSWRATNDSYQSFKFNNSFFEKSKNVLNIYQ